MLHQPSQEAPQAADRDEARAVEVVPRGATKDGMPAASELRPECRNGVVVRFFVADAVRLQHVATSSGVPLQLREGSQPSSAKSTPRPSSPRGSVGRVVGRGDEDHVQRQIPKETQRGKTTKKPIQRHRAGAALGDGADDDLASTSTTRRWPK